MNILNENFQDNITGEGGALVASAATYIATHCKTFEMPENGKFMVHRPMGGVSGTSVVIGNYLKLLQDIDDEYFKHFKSKATDVKDFTKKWNDGDNWMTAKEAKAAGFVTKVRKKITIDKDTQAMISATYNGKFEYPEDTIESTKPKNTNMEILAMLATMVGLQADANDKAVKEAIQGIVNDNATLKQTNADLQAKVDGYEAAEKKKLDDEAKALVEAAQKDGRTDDKGAKKWLELFAKDHESAKAALAAVPTQASVTKKIEDAAKNGGSTGKSAWEKRQAEIEANNKK